MKLIQAFFLELSLMLALAGCSSVATLPPKRLMAANRTEVKSDVHGNGPTEAGPSPLPERGGEAAPGQDASTQVRQIASSNISPNHQAHHRVRNRVRLSPPQEILPEPLPGGPPEAPGIPAGTGSIFEVFPFRPSRKKSGFLTRRARSRPGA